MSNLLLVAALIVSIVMPTVSFFFSLVVIRQLYQEAGRAFEAMGETEGNHEVRLENLETNAGIPVFMSPMMAKSLMGSEEGLEDTAGQSFLHGHEDADLRSGGTKSIELIDEFPLIEDEGAQGAAANEGWNPWGTNEETKNGD
jgi:hypothetical protein